MLVLRAILWNQAIEDGFHIYTNIWIAILVDAQSTTGVLRKDIHDARLWQFRHLTNNLARYQMESTTLWIQSYFNLLYHILILKYCKLGCKNTKKTREIRIFAIKL